MSDKWISVKDKLPELEMNVLVCEDREVTTIAYRYKIPHGLNAGKEVWQVLENCSGYEYEQDDCNPDYWMPLPEPPNNQSSPL